MKRMKKIIFEEICIIDDCFEPMLKTITGGSKMLSCSTEHEQDQPTPFCPLFRRPSPEHQETAATAQFAGQWAPRHEPFRPSLRFADPLSDQAPQDFCQR